MNLKDRLIITLAERLYEAHREWEAQTFGDEGLRPEWYMTNLKIREPFLDAARNIWSTAGKYES